jgi:hypothetical protein
MSNNNKSIEHDKKDITNLKEENMHKNDDAVQKDNLIEELFGSGFNPSQDLDEDNPFKDTVDVQETEVEKSHEDNKQKDYDPLHRDVFTHEHFNLNFYPFHDPNEDNSFSDPGGKPEEEKTNSSDIYRENLISLKKSALKYYSDPYKAKIDPGVPAPLRLYWKDVDESTKKNFPTAKECYCDGKFNFWRFYTWMKVHRRAFIELSLENKKISIRELNKCYEKNGELGGWKLGELVWEKKVYLIKEIKEKKERLKFYKIDLTNHKDISRANIKYHGENEGIHEMRLKDSLEDKIELLEERIKETETSLEKLDRELFDLENFEGRCCIDENGLGEIDRIHAYY